MKRSPKIYLYLPEYGDKIDVKELAYNFGKIDDNINNVPNLVNLNGGALIRLFVGTEAAIASYKAEHAGEISDIIFCTLED